MFYINLFTFYIHLLILIITLYNYFNYKSLFIINFIDRKRALYIFSFYFSKKAIRHFRKHDV